MIRIAQIACFLTVVLAIIVCSAAFGSSEVPAGSFLEELPNAVKEFLAAQGTREKAIKDQIPPLVQEAERFAKYLNPPVKKTVKPSTNRQDKAALIDFMAGAGANRAPASKFSVIATSYHSTRPELSLALINVAGEASCRWVRQSAKVGHSVIEEIRKGSVIVRTGSKTEEFVAPVPERVNLVAGKGATTSKKSVPSIMGRGDIIVNPTIGRRNPTTGTREVNVMHPVRKQPTLSDEEERKRAAKLFAELAAMSASRGGRGQAGGQDFYYPGSDPNSRIRNEELKMLKLLEDELKKDTSK